MTAPEDPGDPFAPPPTGGMPPQTPAPPTPAPQYGPPPPGYGPPAGYGPHAGYLPPPGYGGYPAQGTNGLAIASLCCSVVGCIYGIPAILAIVFGFVARSQIKQTGQQGAGLALAGIIVGFVWIALGLAFLALVVAGIASDSSGCVGTGC